MNIKYPVIKVKFEYIDGQKKFSYIEKNYNSSKENFLYDLKTIDSLDYNICINLKHYDDIFKNALVVLDIDETSDVRDFDLMNILKKSNGLIAQTSRGYHLYMFVSREFLENIKKKDCYLNVYNKKLKSELYTIRDTRLIIVPTKHNKRVILYDNNKRYANKNSDKYIRFSKFIEKLHNLDNDEYLKNNEEFIMNYVISDTYVFNRSSSRGGKAKKNIDNKNIVNLLNKDESKKKTKFRKSLAHSLSENFFDIDYVIQVLRKKADRKGYRNQTFFKFILHIRALMKLYDDFNIKYDYDDVYNKVMDIAFDVYDVNTEKSDIRTVEYMFKEYNYVTFNDYYEYLRTRFIRKQYESINMNISYFLKRNSRVYKISKSNRLFLKNKNKKVAFLRFKLDDDFDMLFDFINTELSVLAVIVNENKSYVDIVIKKKNNSRVYNFYYINVIENYFLEMNRDCAFLVRKDSELKVSSFNEFLFDLRKAIDTSEFSYDNRSVSENIFNKKYSEVKREDIENFIENNKDLNIKERHDIKSRYMYVYTVCIAKGFNDLADRIFDIISKYDLNLYVSLERVRFLKNVDKAMLDRYATIY